VKPKNGGRDSHTQKFTIHELGEGAVKQPKKCYGFDMTKIQFYREEKGIKEKVVQKDMFSGNSDSKKE